MIRYVWEGPSSRERLLWTPAGIVQTPHLVTNVTPTLSKRNLRVGPEASTKVPMVEQTSRISDNGQDAIHACQNLANGLSAGSCFLGHDVSGRK
jgi:hypothetical protein